MTTGMIFDLQRTSLHDGPGIRTAVFLKGCPLRCAWCHNPESQSRQREISFRAEVCVACGECALVCEHGAHIITPANTQGATHTYDRALCDRCGECVPACLYDALKIAGQQMTVEDVMREVRKDVRFYARSGGGLTITGGEPMLQPDFTAALLHAAKAEGIHTCVETCGWASQSAYARVLPDVDLFLFDFKATEPDAHRRLTGADNALILANLDFLCTNGANILLRCPLIAGVNDSAAHLAGIAALGRRYPTLLSIDVLPYHNIGNGKYARYGLMNPLPAVETTSEATKQDWVRQLHELGCTKARLG
jgi:pyruvate formate lyase activating enzyme